MPQGERYLTTLGHAFLVPTRVARGTPAEQLYAALMAGWHDNWHTVGTMAGMSREDTNEAFAALIANDYVQVETPGTRVTLLSKGAVWYIDQVWGIAWHP